MKFIAMMIALAPVAGIAQHTVRIEIASLPATMSTDVIYIAGSFNGWNPHDEKTRFQKDNKGIFFLELKNVAAGSYDFKFTRGSWDKGEVTTMGKDIPNRSIVIMSDTTLRYTIGSWRDVFPVTKRTSTASPQVRVVDTAFAIPQLNRTRRIWIYLPKDYSASGKRYPVLYMHDGQNLFDDATSFAGEWGVDEALDSMQTPCIVVGIDHGGNKRMNEYNPNDEKRFGTGEGRQYLEFIVKNLKPYIDGHYRTLTDKKHSYLAGSSMGGLISFYAGLYYPDVFGGLGVFSPSFQLTPQVKEQIQQGMKKTTHGPQRYYFYAGNKESEDMVSNMKAVADQVKQSANPEIIIVVNPEGKHNEPTWRAEFVAFYKWILQ